MKPAHDLAAAFEEVDPGTARLEPARRPEVSLIICTYNRAKFLGELLSSIEREWTERLDAEVIVVDNNCSDDTHSVVAGFERRIPSLRRVVESQQGLSHARNRGARESRKENLLYFDDDATITEGFLERLEVVLRRFEPDLFGGPVLPRFDRPLPKWFNAKSEIRQFEVISGFTKRGSVSGGNFGIRRDIVERLGGFDTRLGMSGDEMAFGEDRDMVERYRRATAPEKQKIYYAVELPILHYTMPYKFSRSYHYRRKRKNARAQEITFVRAGKRSALRSLFLALAHIAYLPFYALRLGFDHRFNAEYRFTITRHAYGVAGRVEGAFQALFGAARGGSEQGDAHATSKPDTGRPS